MIDSSNDIAISVKNVTKTFLLPHERHNSIKSLFVNIFKHNRNVERQKVLDGVSFDIRKGEFFGIVGRNGSGKSTLLKLLAEIYIPNSGTISVNGMLTPFIELGVGFNPELTGRENVFLNGALLGFSRKEMQSMYVDIVKFAELERFMDQKLKNYSSGMQVRLAFSIAIRAKSDVLLIDEVLAVGDSIFQEKCYGYFKKLKKTGKTVIFVSHDTRALQEFCSRGILINKGKIVGEGAISGVINDYSDLLNKDQTTVSLEKGKEKRWGTSDVVVERSTVLTSGKDSVFTDKDDFVTIRVTYKAKKNTSEPVFGITIDDSFGVRMFQSNTYWSKIVTKDMKKNEKRIVVWEIPNIFTSGEFFISPAVASKRGVIMFDWRENFASMKVRKTLPTTGQTNVNHDIRILK